MPILPTYPEPHAAIPGAPYVLREKFPSADLNQIITNQKSIWAALNSLKYSLIEENLLGKDNAARLTLDTASTTAFVQAANGITMTASTLAVGDIITGVAGPIRFQNLSASGQARIDVVVYYLVGGVATFDGAAVDIRIPASADDTFCIPFRYEMQHASQAIITIEGEAAAGGNIKADGIDYTLYTCGTYRVERPL